MTFPKARELLTWLVVGMAVLVIGVSIVVYRDRKEADRLANQRRVDRNNQLVFLCGQINNLDNAVTGLIKPFPPSPYRTRAVKALDAVSCDPARFHTP